MDHIKLGRKSVSFFGNNFEGFINKKEEPVSLHLENLPCNVFKH